MYDGVVMGLRIDLKGRDDQLSLLKAHIEQPQLQLSNPPSQQRHHHSPPTGSRFPDERSAALSPGREASFHAMLPRLPDLNPSSSLSRHQDGVDDLLDAIKRGKVAARPETGAGIGSPPRSGTSGRYPQGGHAHRRVSFESPDDDDNVGDQGRAAAGLAAAAVGRFKDETGEFSFSGPSDAAIASLKQQIATGSPSSRSSGMDVDDEHAGGGEGMDPSTSYVGGIPSVLGQLQDAGPFSSAGTDGGSSVLGLLLRAAAMEGADQGAAGGFTVTEQNVPQQRTGSQDWREALGTASRDLIGGFKQ